jgi:hypothetical protein
MDAVSLDYRTCAALVSGAHLTVHSVFERAVNLTDSGGLLLGLVGPDGGNGPNQVVLAALPAGGFTSLSLERGCAAMVDTAERLIIGRRLAVQLAAATLWRPPPVVWRAEPPELVENLRLAAGLAFTLRGGDGLGPLLPDVASLAAGDAPPANLPLLARTAWLALTDLLAAWRAGDQARIAQAAHRLIGLGPGQTPSGDDLLAGLMVALLRLSVRDASPSRFHSERSEESAGRATPCDDQPSGLISENSIVQEHVGSPLLRFAQSDIARVTRTIATAAIGRTTDLGLARLRYAAEGDLDEHSMDVLAALVGDNRAALDAATRRLLAFGHSSGVDTLVGLLVGCRLADEQVEVRTARGAR